MCVWPTHSQTFTISMFVDFSQWRWYTFYICILVCLFQTTYALSTLAKHIHTEIALIIEPFFKSMGNLHFSREYWFQPIPDRLTSPKGFSVNKQACTKLNCQFFQSLLDQINVIQVHIIRLTPEEWLYPFDGSLSLSLFGTATMDDVNISASHINALTKTSNNIVNALQKHNEHMTSFMSTANKRMDYLQFSISKNFKPINQFSKTFFFN